ncbi:MAG: Druantia anti-phage system protein DruA [Sulfobacillus sp.]
MPHWTAPLEVRPFRPEERDLWRRLMATHHCLGFRGLVGESLYYVACVENEWVALLGWAAAAWMCRPRDQWIGWTGAQQWARLSADWQLVYGHPVVLAETFVDPTRFAGTSCRAAGWQYLGDTQGFARQHHRYVRHGHPKGLWVRPLDPDSPAVLHAPFLSAALTQEALTMLDFNALNWSGPGSLRERLTILTDPRHRPNLYP